jgi:D-sedoheptulose 7-phosphate isomerase
MSANVIKAAEVAKGKGAGIVAFTGRKNSPLEAMADLCLCADAAQTARSQEIHQLAYHIVCDLVERSFAESVD